MIKSLLHIALIFGLISCANQTQDSYEIATDETVLDCTFLGDKTSIVAGQDLQLEFKVQGIQDNETVQLICSHKFGPIILESKVKTDVITFTLDSSITKKSGLINLELYHEKLKKNAHSIQILPKEAIGKMEAFNGPKTLFANDDDGSMLVVIPKDEFDNPMNDGAMVHFSQRGTRGNTKAIKQTVSGLVAYNISGSMNKAGKVLLGAQISAAAIEEQELIFEPAMPSKLIIKTQEWYPTADKRQNIHLSTLPIFDQYMNLVPDGTLINFTVRNKGNVISVYNGFTVNGVANIYIQNPSKATNWQLQAGLYGSIFSNILHFQFEENTMNYKLVYNAKSNQVVIGPVTGKNQKLLPDGTAVKAVFMLNGETYNHKEELYDGYAQFTLSEAFYKTTEIEYSININDNFKKGKISK